MMLNELDSKLVSLGPGDYYSRRELVRQYLASFPVDRLLHTFRINAGMPSAAKPLGGWESETCELRGHFVGHFLSACARFAHADQDQFFTNLVSEIVTQLAACARPDGYLSAFPDTVLDTLEFEEDRNVWAPYYTLHKILQGLIDCANLIGNKSALKLAINLAYYIRQRFQRLSYWKIDNMLRCTRVNPVNEFGGIGDSLYTLYELTDDDAILALARMFDREYWIGDLAKGNDNLENLHANTHLPMILAAMHRYDLTDETRYQVATRNFYTYLLGRTFANGNSSSKATAYIAGQVSERAEHWSAYGQLADALTGGESESCCAHQTLDLLGRFLVWNPDPAYLDHMERLLFSAVLNCASNESGLSQYHQPMGYNCTKTFSTPFDTFWCCTASGVQAFSDIQRKIWYTSDDTILLGQYISSTVDWQEKGVALRLDTAFPDSAAACVTVQVLEPVASKLAFRAGTLKNIRINGQAIDCEIDHGFLICSHTFEDNNQIQFEICADLRRETLPGSPERVAILYGNILLAGLTDSEGPLNVPDRPPTEWIRRTDDQKLTFTAQLPSATFNLIPLFRVQDERYTVYFTQARFENDVK